MVALLFRVGLVVLVAYLQILYIKRCRVTVLGTQGTILCRHVAIGILQGCQRLVDPGLDAVEGCQSTVPQSHVHHIERLGTQILGHLQILVESQSVGGAIAPVHVPVSRPFLYRSDGALPAEGILWRDLSLYETAAREAHKPWVHLVEHLHEVRAQTVLAILKGRRKERHHVELHQTLAVEQQGEGSLGVVGGSGEGGGVFAPLLLVGGKTADNTTPSLPADRCLGIYRCAVFAAKGGLHRALVGALGPE